MTRFLSWLFGQSDRSDDSSDKKERSEARGRSEPDQGFGGSSDLSLPGQAYFAQLERLTKSVSAQDYEAAAAAARASLPLVRSWLSDTRGDGQRLDIRIPALSQGGTMMAITGDREGLAQLRELVQDFDNLEAYREEAEEHFTDLDLFDRIREVIRRTPGVKQNQMKTELDIEDGRRASRLISYLEKSGEIQRVNSGKTYELYLADFNMPETAVENIYIEPASPGAHRVETRVVKPCELDLKRIKHVPLPPSPNVWERPVKLPSTREAFADPEGAWREIVIEPFAKEDRPDPAFRRHYSTLRGTLSFDDLAKSNESLGAPGAVRFSNAKGQTGTTAPLRRDPYHIAVHPVGEGFASRSKSNVLTVYAGDLQVDFETDLESAPEIATNRERLGLTESEAHRTIRCVALTPERDRYLFTHVDEAWCISRDGERIWGLRMPANEPTRFRVGGLGFGTASEIDEALEVLGLDLPVTPEVIRKRYRQLARQFHPDINPGSEEKMKAVNVAAERLTGLDADQLAGKTVDDGGFEIVVSFGASADWIYAAAFSADGMTALLGSYAGRVVRVDQNGTPTTIYDVGSAPVRIVETDAYLYVMTTTRLYVLQGDCLIALEDCPGKCDLLIFEEQVLLVEAKGVRVFALDGRPLGIALTKAPIRRAYVVEGDLVIETRTHRGRFRGIQQSPRR